MEMPGVNYPLQCNIPIDLRRIQSQIFDWLENNVLVHFIYNAHSNENCSQEFTQALYGLHPQRKIILIDSDMEIDK